MEHKIGFAGAGRMVSHIVDGLLKQEDMRDRIIVTGRSMDRLDKFNEERGVEVSTDFSILSRCHIIVAGVTPGATVPVMERLNEAVPYEDAIFLSIAGGVSLENIETVMPGRKAVRCMPNIAVSSNSGVLAMAGGGHISSRDKRYISGIFEDLGIVEWVDESLMRYVPSLTGSSPAFAFIMIEAMADKAVSAGFERQQAYRLAAQALAGAGKMLVETGAHPGMLKDQITTSGGSTIQGVMKLEEEGFRKSVMQAMQAVNDANEI